MLLNLKKTIFFILRFSAYGLALAFLFLLLSNNISLIDKSFSSFFKLNRHSFNNAVESTAPAVVNVYANKVYQEKGHSVFGHPMFKQFFGTSPQLTKTRRNNSIGSGVIMNKAGYILTNAHVIENAENIGITLNSGEQLQAKLIGLD